MLQVYLRLHVHLWYRRTQHDDTARCDNNEISNRRPRDKRCVSSDVPFLRELHNC